LEVTAVFAAGAVDAEVGADEEAPDGVAVTSGLEKVRQAERKEQESDLWLNIRSWGLLRVVLERRGRLALSWVDRDHGSFVAETARLVVEPKRLRVIDREPDLGKPRGVDWDPIGHLCLKID
jgi:hypothetical protein